MQFWRTLGGAIGQFCIEDLIDIILIKKIIYGSGVHTPLRKVIMHLIFPERLFSLQYKCLEFYLGRLFGEFYSTTQRFGGCRVNGTSSQHIIDSIR